MTILLAYLRIYRGKFDSKWILEYLLFCFVVDMILFMIFLKLTVMQ